MKLLDMGRHNLLWFVPSLRCGGGGGLEFPELNKHGEIKLNTSKESNEHVCILSSLLLMVND